jgi:subtilase family serine protease
MPGVYLPVETYPTSDAAAVTVLSVQAGDGNFGPAGAYDARINDVDGGTRVYVAYVAPLRQQNGTTEENA